MNLIKDLEKNNITEEDLHIVDWKNLKKSISSAQQELMKHRFCWYCAYSYEECKDENCSLNEEGHTFMIPVIKINSVLGERK